MAALAVLLLSSKVSPPTDAESVPPSSSGTEYQAFLPQVATPWRWYSPAVMLAAAASTLPDSAQASMAASDLFGAAPQPLFVERAGERLLLDGQPYTFLGTNAYYLAGPFFPEALMPEVIATLAGNGVQVIRVFVQPWCDLARIERMLDYGNAHGLRFILTLEDFYGRTDGWWFKSEYKEVGLPHIRNIVPRFAGRPEVLMWELMNEPVCPAQDANQACWDALYKWAQVTSEEIKRLDPNHLVSVGTQRAGFLQQEIDNFRRIHALDSIDIVSVHGSGGRLSEGERALERAIAHELGKPIFFGEVHIAGHDMQCQPLSKTSLEERATAIAADLDHLDELGIDGYLLWQFAYGGVDLGSHMQYFCGELEYFADDPAWQVIEAHQ